MTNHWIDIRNSDCILIIGSNAAENHPISFKWVTEAMDRGAKLIHVDPRFSRTSSKADTYVRIRSGTDIAFMGGMIYHLLEDMRRHPGDYNIDYVSQYTNAAYIVNSGIRLPGDEGQDGLFSVWDGNKYDRSTWKYDNMDKANAEPRLLSPNWSDWTNRASDNEEEAWADLDDFCVLRLLWKQYRRYDKDTVSRITGVPIDTLEEVYTEYARTGKAGKAGTIMYAMGATQHTYGAQNIRTYAMVQLLLGNIGVAGGGINALRGTSNVQGSTDMCLLSHILPGYLKVPLDTDSDMTFDGYIERITPKTCQPPDELAADNSANWWGNTEKYVVSLLKAWWPDTEHKDGYHYLPKGRDGVNYTHIGMFEAMGEGQLDGLWVWGQNPAVAGPNSNGEREALGKLKWLVVSDIWMNETAEFWRRPGVNPADINTEVFVLPAAASYEKEGSISNSGRWAQWRYRAVLPPGEGKPDLEIMSRLVARIKQLYEEEGGTAPEPISDLHWSYADEADPEEVAREINGYALESFTFDPGGPKERQYAEGELIDSFVHLQDSGKTSSGNWLYCNQYTVCDEATAAKYPEAAHVVNGFNVINKTQKRSPVDTSLEEIGLYANWAWCWPVNRRIIYNRASVDLNGQPWDSEHPVIKRSDGAWLGDVPDGGWAAINEAAEGGKYLPFIMLAEGVGRLWGYGLKDGPIPEVYEPWESPISNVMSAQENNPAAFIGQFMNPRGTAGLYPYVGTTYRCTEHWQSGIMTRNLPWLAEMVPEMYVELGDDLADGIGIRAGDKVRVSSARGSIKAVAVVTKRFQGITVDGKTIHQIGVLWHWGYAGMHPGDSGNVLTPHVGDANTTIPEYKTFLCNVEKLTETEAANV